MTIRTLLVGSHYCPPAKQVLKCLPRGAIVQLVPEPDNPYDEQAIKVLLNDVSQIDTALLILLNDELVSHGSSFGDVCLMEQIALGHVAASEGKPLAKANSRYVGKIVGTKELAGLVPCEAGLEWVGEDVMIWIEPQKDQLP